MVIIRKYQEPELETNQTQNKKVFYMVRMCRRAQSTSTGEANRTSFIDDSSNLYTVIQELTTRIKTKLFQYLNSLYHALRLLLKLLC